MGKWCVNGPWEAGRGRRDAGFGGRGVWRGRGCLGRVRPAWGEGSGWCGQVLGAVVSAGKRGGAASVPNEDSRRDDLVAVDEVGLPSQMEFPRVGHVDDRDPVAVFGECGNDGLGAIV